MSHLLLELLAEQVLFKTPSSDDGTVLDSIWELTFRGHLTIFPTVKR